MATEDTPPHKSCTMANRATAIELPGHHALQRTKATATHPAGVLTATTGRKSFPTEPSSKRLKEVTVSSVVRTSGQKHEKHKNPGNRTPKENNFPATLRKKNVDLQIV